MKNSEPYLQYLQITYSIVKYFILEFEMLILFLKIRVLFFLTSYHLQSDR